MKTKTIILSNINTDSNISGRGILSFYIEDEILYCKLRLYNIPSFYRYTKLAIYHQDQVYSANLLERNGCFESSFVGDFDLEKDFYSAVIDTTNDNKIIIAGGTYSGFFFENLKDELSSVIPDNNTVDSLGAEENKVNEIEKYTNCSDCSNCKYKQFFYEYNPKQDLQTLADQSTQESTVQNYTETTIPENLIESIIPQFDYIFEKYPINQELSALIENSKFVEMNENSQCFSIGAIYQDNNIKYICYAVKSSYNQPAPSELGDHYQWVPTDAEDPLSDGYYIVFQDATDLKIVEL